MTLTVQQVQNAIENEAQRDPEYDEEVGAAEFYGDWWGKAKTDGKVLSIDGTEFIATFVEEYGGMDMGSDRWVVFKIGDQFFKKNGAYYSHDGEYWDGSLDEVKPVEKVVTVFE